MLRWVSDAVRILLERGFVYRISTRYSGKNPWAYRCSSKHDPSAYCHAGRVACSFLDPLVERETW